MTLDEFCASVAAPELPAGVAGALEALWRDARNDWDGAHRTVQDDESPHAAWVHAYLHRKEGDLSNAAHWYRRAARDAAQGSLESEWRAIAAALLAHDR